MPIIDGLPAGLTLQLLILNSFKSLSTSRMRHQNKLVLALERQRGIGRKEQRDGQEEQQQQQQNRQQLCASHRSNAGLACVVKKKSVAVQPKEHGQERAGAPRRTRASPKARARRNRKVRKVIAAPDGSPASGKTATGAAAGGNKIADEGRHQGPISPGGLALCCLLGRVRQSETRRT